MAGEGDVYEIVDKSVMFGQEVDNIYFYKRTAPVLIGNPAQQVADAYIASVLPAVVAVQSPQVVHTEIIVTNLFDATDKHTALISEAGTVTGDDTESSFTAVGVRLVQDNGAIRNGAKRYAGVIEGKDTNGVITDAGLITSLVALGVALVAGVDIGLVGDALIPVIVKRIVDGAGYRLPTNSGEAVLGNITDALYNVQETSQVSRKVGRGV